MVCFYVLLERRPILAGVAGGLIIGGSLGNLVQRLSGEGKVTDFMKFPYWPNFNMADVFLVVGIVIVFLGLAGGDHPGLQSRPPGDAGSSLTMSSRRADSGR